MNHTRPDRRNCLRQPTMHVDMKCVQYFFQLTTRKFPKKIPSAKCESKRVSFCWCNCNNRKIISSCQRKAPPSLEHDRRYYYHKIRTERNERKYFIFLHSIFAITLRLMITMKTDFLSKQQRVTDEIFALISNATFCKSKMTLWSGHNTLLDAELC